MKIGLLIGAIIECIYFVYAGNNICPGKIKNIVYVMLCGFLGTCGVIFEMQILLAVGIGITTFLFVLFYSDDKWKLAVPFLSVAIGALIGYTMVLQWLDDPFYWVLGAAIYLIIILTMLAVKRHYFHIVTMINVGINMLLACGMSWCLGQHIWAIAFLVGIELLLEVNVQMQNYNYKKNNLQLKEEMMLHQYSEIKEMYLNMRGWRHDYHNHVQVLKAQLDAGNPGLAREYLNNIEHELGKVDTFVKSGNLMVDAVLNSKLTIAIAQKIQVDCDVYLPETLFVEDADLCTLLGNVLDNAIEACEELNTEATFIRIYMVMRKQQLYLSVQNVSDEKAIQNQDQFISSKRGNHGLGLKRVDMVVKKYGGFLYLSKEPGVFGVEIMMPEPSEESIRIYEGAE